jgi:hypothetical protein
MITEEHDRAFNIMLTIILGFFIVLAFNSLFESPRIIYIESESESEDDSESDQDNESNKN